MESKYNLNEKNKWVKIKKKQILSLKMSEKMEKGNSAKRKKKETERKK